MKPFNADKGLRKLKTKKNINNYIKYGTLVVALLLFVATVIYLTRATYTSRHDFELINAKVGEFTLNIDINLHTDGGEINSYVVHGRRKTPIGTLPEPVKLGYVFTGWYSSPNFADGTGVNEQTIVHYGLTDLYAKYAPSTYELEIDPNGGEIKNGNVSEQVEYKGTKVLPEVERTGYNFDGWDVIKGDDTTISESINEESGKTIYTVTMGYRNSIVRANWSINSYTLTFDKNNGTPNQTMTVEYNSTVPIMDPSKTGYTFTGWTNIEKLVGGRMPAEDVVLTANYTVNNYKWLVNHNIMNGDGTGYDFVEAETGDGAYGTKFKGTLKNYPGFKNPPQREGVIAEDVKPGEAGDPIHNVLNYDYVREANNLTISPNGGIYNGSIDPTIINNVYFEQIVELDSVTREGYDFREWTITGTNASVEGSTVTMGSDSATVKAQWDAKCYTVTYNVNGGNTLETNSRTVCYDDSYGQETELPTPQRTGYSFDGWYTDVSGGTQITNATKVQLSDNQTIYAHWTANIYSVSYNVCGGNALSPATKSVRYDSNYGKDINGNTEALATPSATGYTFTGWYLGTSCNDGVRVYDSTPVSTASNHTLYAHWMLNSFTVYFDQQSGSGGSTSVTAIYGNAMPSATAPSRPGYSFGGYYTGTGGTGTQYYNSLMGSVRNYDIASNTTLYAKWTVNSYTVTLNKQCGSDVNGGSAVATYGNAMPAVGVPYCNDIKEFLGYFTEPGAQGTQYYTSTMASARAYDLTSSTTLYAGWREQVVLMDSNCPNPNSGNNMAYKWILATYGAPMPKTDRYYGNEILPLHTCTGYKFSGYKGTSAMGERVYYDANMNSVRNWDIGTEPHTSSNAYTLYPIWEPGTYQVTLDANGGTTKISTISVTYGSAMPAISSKTTRDGYKFLGYYDQKTSGTSGSCSGTQYYTSSMESSRTWNKEDATLFACWKKST